MSKKVFATEVEFTVRLVVEHPDGEDNLNLVYTDDWLGDQIGKWMSLPFDNDTRSVLEIDIETLTDSWNLFQYELNDYDHLADELDDPWDI